MCHASLSISLSQCPEQSGGGHIAKYCGASRICIKGLSFIFENVCIVFNTIGSSHKQIVSKLYPFMAFAGTQDEGVTKCSDV